MSTLEARCLLLSKALEQLIEAASDPDDMTGLPDALTLAEEVLYAQGELDDDEEDV